MLPLKLLNPLILVRSLVHQKPRAEPEPESSDNIHYAKYMSLKYDKPRYRVTFTPKVLYWEITHIWVLKHWGKDIACEPGGYKHKFYNGETNGKYFDGEILYYRTK